MSPAVMDGMKLASPNVVVAAGIVRKCASRFVRSFVILASPTGSGVAIMLGFSGLLVVVMFLLSKIERHPKR